MRVPFSYLDRQFHNLDDYLEDLRAFVKTGDFTLGKPLTEFEERFGRLVGMPYVVGVASGTDALILSMKISGIGPGDDVITTPMTFIATVGAIAATGARPVFVDSEDGFVIDPEKIEAALTPRTRAIVPVHYTGNVADMPRITEIAARKKLLMFEDACQAIAARLDDKSVGSWGETASFSLHPLKNLNVWSDGGLIATRSRDLADKLRLYRNHGLATRDEVTMLGVNSRLDTLQAVIGNRLIGSTEEKTARRIAIARRYDDAFAGLMPLLQVPRRRPGVRHVFHLYMVRTQSRNELLSFLQQREIEAKIHYPIPLHLQPAMAHLGYKKGDFPVCERDCEQIITLPAHPYLTDEEVEYVIEQVLSYFRK